MVNLEKFWNKIKNRKFINNEGCWLYTGDIDPVIHYGRIQIRGRRLHVHRISCAYHHKLDLSDSKQFACHKCENRRCFNPEHLYIGNNHTNQKDANKFCKMGHDMAIHGAWAVNIGRKYCKTCHKERQRINNLIRKAAGQRTERMW